MANYEKKAPAVRGSERTLKNARLETFDGVKTTGSGKKLLRVAFHAPVNVGDASEGEIKVGSTLWEKDAEKYANAPKGGRVNVSGYEKKGKPWTTQDGRVVVSNEFVVTSIEPVKGSAAKPKAVEPVDEWTDTGSGEDDIPF